MTSDMVTSDQPEWRLSRSRPFRPRWQSFRPPTRTRWSTRPHRRPSWASSSWLPVKGQNKKMMMLAKQRAQWRLHQFKGGSTFYRILPLARNLFKNSFVDSNQPFIWLSLCSHIMVSKSLTEVHWEEQNKKLLFCGSLYSRDATWW